MKRTNVVLDEDLVHEAKKVSGKRTTRAVLDYALRELVRRKRLCEFRRLRGKIHWEGDLEEMRRTRTFE
jgi:Arc/MetJ family transcription regulator